MILQHFFPLSNKIIFVWKLNAGLSLHKRGQTIYVYQLSIYLFIYSREGGASVDACWLRVLLWRHLSRRGLVTARPKAETLHFRSFQIISGHFSSFQFISGHFRSFQNMFWPALEAVPFLIFVIFSPVPREWCGEVRMDRIKQSSPGRREEQTWAQLCDEFNIYDKSFQTFTHFKSWLLPNWSAGMLCILLQFSEFFG